jgi:hypothetical protein
MNGAMRKLLLVGIGVMLWTVWLSHTDIAFDKKISLILYAGNLQGHPLDQDVVSISEGGTTHGTTQCMSPFGNRDNGNLRQAWVAV